MNPAQQRPEPLIFFIDECLGQGVGEALKKAGAEVRFYGVDIPRGTPDAVWLATIGEKKWICLTKDKAIRRRPQERKALEEAGVKAFVLTSGNLPGAEMAALFANNLRRMEKMARNIPGPFIATVTRTGIVALPPGIPGR
ncbi:MAG: hypothetical protein ABSE73_26980 [Planctomycetota bacterium]